MPNLWQLGLFLNGFSFYFNGLMLLTGFASSRGASFFFCLTSGVCVLLLLLVKEKLDV